MAKKDERELLIAEINMPAEGGGPPVQIGQFFYMDRMKATDMLSLGYATKPTTEQRRWLNNQSGRDRYNRRDMNAKDA